MQLIKAVNFMSIRKVITAIQQRGVLYLFRFRILPNLHDFLVSPVIKAQVTSTGVGLRTRGWPKVERDNQSAIEFGSNCTIYDHALIQSVRFSYESAPGRIKLGNKCVIKDGAAIKALSGEVKLGNMVALGRRSEILCLKSRVVIGNMVRIGADVWMNTGIKEYSRADIPIAQQSRSAAPIIVGDDCWIGNKAIILPGITVGEKSVVGAGAVVTHDVEPGSVVAGVPARPIGARKK